MTDLVTRLQRLSGSNPVARVILLPEDWPEIERLVTDAARYRELVSSETEYPLETEATP